MIYCRINEVKTMSINFASAGESIGNAIIDMAQKCKEISREDEGDYRDGRGLLICGKCGEQKEAVISFDGRRKTIVPCVCKCINEQKEREEKKRRSERVREAVFDGSAKMISMTFENDDGQNPVITEGLKHYTGHFDELDGKGLLLWGLCGRGKTFAGAEVLNALIDSGKLCIFVKASEVARAGSDYRNGTEYIKKLCRADVLMIDDFGTLSDARSLDVLDELIDGCVRNNVVLIVTTNIPLEEIKNPKDVTHKRMYDRLIEKCYPIEFNGKDRRRVNAGRSFLEVKRIIEG